MIKKCLNFYIIVFFITEKKLNLEKKNKLSVVCGGLIGAVNGLFGGGGGMIAVPLLSGGLNFSQKQAHATAILIILPVCAISALIYILSGYTNPNVIIPATLGNVAGGILGAKFLGKIPVLMTEIIFIAVMLTAGIRMVMG
ncbi:MAG: TSUP family transporter [Candidatus Coproplasma sp.]